MTLSFPDTVERWPLDRLIPHARNARTHSEDQVAQIAGSIAEFGFVNPVLVGDDGVIVAGHGRVLAARKLAGGPAFLSEWAAKSGHACLMRQAQRQ
jgi:hypothetical protein